VKIAEVKPWWKNDKDRDAALVTHLWDLRPYYFCPAKIVEKEEVHPNVVVDPPQIANGDGNGKANGHANGEKKSVFDFLKNRS
jgi:hypothetical protein